MTSKLTDGGGVVVKKRGEGVGQLNLVKSLISGSRLLGTYEYGLLIFDESKGK